MAGPDSPGGGLADTYKDSKDVLEYLTGVMFDELKDVATEAEKVRRKKQQQQQPQQQQQQERANKSPQKFASTDKPEHEAAGGAQFWVNPETGGPGSGLPRSPPASPPPPPPRSGVVKMTPQQRGGGGVGGDEEEEGGGGAKQLLNTWTSRVSQAGESLRGALSRGPLAVPHTHDQPADTAAPRLAQPPSRLSDADPKNNPHAGGWRQVPKLRRTFFAAQLLSLLSQNSLQVSRFINEVKLKLSRS